MWEREGESGTYDEGLEPIDLTTDETPPGPSTLSNTALDDRSFAAQMIAARVLDGTDGQLILARTIVPENHVAPGKTVHQAFAFSVAESAKVFTLVVRADLESAKRAGVAVEIDLNCC